MNVWEIHPQLVVFPVAFLIGAAILDVYAAATRKAHLVPVATGLLKTGLVVGVLAALAGVVAYRTAPHATQEIDDRMFQHGVIAVVGFALCLVAAHTRRGRGLPPPVSRWLVVVGALTIGFAGHLGERLVFRDAVGVTAPPSALEPPVGEFARGAGEPRALDPTTIRFSPGP